MDKAEGFLQPGNFLELNNSLLLLLLLLLSHVWVFGIPGKHARLPCPSPTPGACSNSHPLSQWCHPTISSSVVPLSSHLQPFPASGSFPVSQFFAPGGQRIGVSASISVLPVNIQGWSTSTLTKFWMGKSKVEFGERDITLVSMSCLFLLMSLETESRNIERKDTLTHSWCRKGLCVVRATQEFQNPLIYLVECGNETTEPTMAEGSVWLLNAEGVIIFSMCGSSYQKLTVRVGWGRDLHFLFFIIETCFFFFIEKISALNCATGFLDMPFLFHLYLLFPTTKAWGKYNRLVIA